MEKIKPCPFYGKTNPEYIGRCNNCDAIGPYWPIGWNTRPLEDSLRAIIAAQAEVIEALEWWQEVRQTLWVIRAAVILPPVLRTKYARRATKYHYRSAESEAVRSLLHANGETARTRAKLREVQYVL